MEEIVLYGRDGCHLCDEARTVLLALLEERRAAGLPCPVLVERDLATDPERERAYFGTIPVLELGDRRLELATSAAKIRRLLATLDEPEAPAPR